jgi:hypothetical protein
MAEEQLEPETPQANTTANESSRPQRDLLRLLGELRTELDRILTSLPAGAPTEFTSSDGPVSRERDDTDINRTDASQD